MNKCKDDQRVIITDEQIIEMYWRREECAIQETDERYGQFLYRIAYNILHDHNDSEECKNDTYFGVWNVIPLTRPNFLPLTFLVVKLPGGKAAISRSSSSMRCKISN